MKKQAINNLPEPDFIEILQPFSTSKLWQLQRAYFKNAGIDAWRSGQVPHYITSNPVMGKTYAEVVFAFLKDLDQRSNHSEQVYLLELGAGHGRLCYHFLKHFEKLVYMSPLKWISLCYVLSDLAQSNLEFWKTHPRLQPYLYKNWVDFAIVDATQVTEIALQYSGDIITPGSLAQPIIVTANYFFDSIPQELFYIDAQHQLHECLVSLFTSPGAEGNTPVESIENIQVLYTNQVSEKPPFAEPYSANLLDQYQQLLADTYLLFPHIGITCLNKLKQLSQKGLMLLTADKGYHRESDLHGVGAPNLVKHGSFSLSVNFNALKRYCENEGGKALFPRHMDFGLSLGCMLFINDAANYPETRLAYERFVNDFGPDDYFVLKKLLEHGAAALTFNQLVCAVRLSGYDAHLFGQLLPRLHEILETITDDERWGMFQLIHRVWDTYYTLGEANDIAFELGRLLLRLCFYKEAIIYFDISGRIYGEKNDVLYHIAICYCELNRFDEAGKLADKILINDPKHLLALDLLAKLGVEKLYS
ncbi:SAM-dependent methyltransferase [Mucilaginibacter polytrichastri]|uniref:Uncharacterized protein n=1 Tax=Mucilaginibacter polytrichastri TaxID=1302689 RepID=A0A1Q5ZXK6_9SPHI|nr:SAM-dependent methyltransferase [Mucilaginibacter polytrichastri]OKS86505.1 hypothetical protein RG47T_1961 [Mucilaginibacter polytrichastri]SFS79147.1 SAM-dependent methyltransferase, MidA family [Mucilaginibacter polytrichastri]